MAYLVIILHNDDDDYVDDDDDDENLQAFVGVLLKFPQPYFPDGTLRFSSCRNNFTTKLCIPISNNDPMHIHRVEGMYVCVKLVTRFM